MHVHALCVCTCARVCLFLHVMNVPGRRIIWLAVLYTLPHVRVAPSKRWGHASTIPCSVPLSSQQNLCIWESLSERFACTPLWRQPTLTVGGMKRRYCILAECYISVIRMYFITSLHGPTCYATPFLCGGRLKRRYSVYFASVSMCIVVFLIFVLQPTFAALQCFSAAIVTPCVSIAWHYIHPCHISVCVYIIRQGT